MTAPGRSDSEPSVAELIAARPHLSMHAMDGLLLDGAALNAVADRLGTPTWVYSADAIRARFARLRHAMPDVAIHYAVKANDHLAVLSLLARLGAGADAVSAGEILRALRAGVPAGRIVFSGVGKTEAEIALALREGVGQVNAESAEEVDRISAVATSLGATAPVAIRVNPDVDAGAHDKISTGRKGDKFGVPIDEAAALFARARRLPGLRMVGLAVHIGSQIAAAAPYREAFAKLASLAAEIGGVEAVDCGGGLGICYRDEAEGSPAALAGAMRAAFEKLGVRLAIEPGRWLVGPAGVLLASVILTRESGGTRFVVLDAAMNDLVRPALYDAWHGIVPLSAVDALAPASPCDVVGPVCETGDTFARGRSLPPLAPGARVAILDAGAYGAVMSSTYNARPLAAQAMVDGGRWTTIRARQDLSALWAGEIVPELCA
jgi:diaminopimelate decarboxylase